MHKGPVADVKMILQNMNFFIPRPHIKRIFNAHLSFHLSTGWDLRRQIVKTINLIPNIRHQRCQIDFFVRGQGVMKYRKMEGNVRTTNLRLENEKPTFCKVSVLSNGLPMAWNRTTCGSWVVGRLWAQFPSTEPNFVNLYPFHPPVILVIPG